MISDASSDACSDAESDQRNCEAPQNKHTFQHIPSLAHSNAQHYNAQPCSITKPGRAWRTLHSDAHLGRLCAVMCSTVHWPLCSAHSSKPQLNSSFQLFSASPASPHPHLLNYLSPLLSECSPIFWCSFWCPSASSIPFASSMPAMGSVGLC